MLNQYYDSVEETVQMDTQVEHAAPGGEASGAGGGPDAPGTSAAAAAAGGEAGGEAATEAEAEEGQGSEILPDAGEGGAAPVEGGEAAAKAD